MEKVIKQTKEQF